MRTLILASLVFAACELPREEIADDIQAELGNLDFSSEEPLFGDRHRPEFVGAGENEATQAIQGPPPALTTESTTVWAGWGHFIGTRDEEEVLDWTGTLSTDTGTLALIRTVKFDRRDSVQPAPDEKTIAFTSHTRPHFDGLIARLDATAGARIMLDTPRGVFTQTPSSTPQNELFDVEGTTARVAMLSLPLDAEGTCTHAVMTGRWRTVDERRRHIEGRLVGRWFTPDGTLVGHWRAFMGTRDDGTKQVFGKIIDENGAALALLKGSFDDDSVDLEVLRSDESALGSIRLPLVRDGAQRVHVLGVADVQGCL